VRRHGCRRARGAGVVIVKVCGVRTPGVAEVAVDAGADWIGLMLVPKSSRWVGDADALAVMHAVRAHADLVGVFVEPTVAECDDAASRYRLVTACSVPVIPVFNVESRAGASSIDWPPDTLVMLDGRPDRGALPGGTGHRVPLDWAADVARHRRILLAGGLGADDVGDVVATVRPAGVDASSRLERGPGDKDPALVRSFVLAARAAAAALEVERR
jgi:phosphoribosylanthranilate isomerase